MEPQPVAVSLLRWPGSTALGMYHRNSLINALIVLPIAKREGGVRWLGAAYRRSWASSRWPRRRRKAVLGRWPRAGREIGVGAGEVGGPVEVEAHVASAAGGSEFSVRRA